ncbi:hypothetical protein [Streptomyces sp. NPDC006739]|uniref:hypothetical protein n=1 Tax=Streptomyces sp. NPDC006739 TaxID=3364763 RepID=UPI003686E8CB
MASTRRRLRSTTVVLGGMGLLAAALTACSSEPDKRCVDRNSHHIAKGYKVVADRNCKSTKVGKVGKISADGAWYYGGKKQGAWVDGGSFVRPGSGSGGSGGSSDDDHRHHRTGVHRGGFGHGSGHGSGG